MKTILIKYKNIICIMLVAVGILLIPLVAMQFTDQVVWDLADFMVLGALLLGAGLVYELVASKLKSVKHRVVFGVVLVAVLLLIWVELAVGIFD